MGAMDARPAAAYRACPSVGKPPCRNPLRTHIEAGLDLSAPGALCCARVRTRRALARRLTTRVCEFFHRVLPVAKRDTDEMRKAFRTAGLVLYVPVFMVVAPVAGYFAGQWVDSKLGTTWVSWLGILMGFGVAARQIYHIVRRLQREQEQENIRK